MASELNVGGINGTLGATTPASVVATTVNASGQIYAGAAAGNISLSVSGYDTLKWTDTTLHFGGLTAAQWTQLKTYIGGSTITTVSSTGLAVTGNITAPTNPAFNVSLSTAQLNLAINTWVTILLDTERFDQGANFNTGTYTFTAPVTGKYQLNVNLRLDNIDTAANYYQIAIATSNKTYYFTVDVGVLASDPIYWEVPLSVLADMDASDTAYVKVYQEAGTAQTDVSAISGESSFSGYLAC